MATQITPENVSIISALYQANSNVECAKQQFKTAYERLQSSMRDIERDMENDYISGTQYIQARGCEMDAASAKLAAAIEGQKLVKSIADAQGITLED